MAMVTAFAERADHRRSWLRRMHASSSNAVWCVRPLTERSQSHRRSDAFCWATSSVMQDSRVHVARAGRVVLCDRSAYPITVRQQVARLGRFSGAVPATVAGTSPGAPGRSRITPLGRPRTVRPANRSVRRTDGLGARHALGS